MKTAVQHYDAYVEAMLRGDRHWLDLEFELSDAAYLEANRHYVAYEYAAGLRRDDEDWEDVHLLLEELG